MAISRCFESILSKCHVIGINKNANAFSTKWVHIVHTSDVVAILLLSIFTKRQRKQNTQHWEREIPLQVSAAAHEIKWRDEKQKN